MPPHSRAMRTGRDWISPGRPTSRRVPSSDYHIPPSLPLCVYLSFALARWTHRHTTAVNNNNKNNNFNKSEKTYTDCRLAHQIAFHCRRLDGSTVRCAVHCTAYLLSVTQLNGTHSLSGFFQFFWLRSLDRNFFLFLFFFLFSSLPLHKVCL